MAKKNTFMERMEKARFNAMLNTHRFTRQLMVDVSCIALNKEFGFGADRLKRFAEAMLGIYEEYADLWNSDTPDTEYSRAALDAKLKQIFGDDVQTWEERYGNL